jgi:hypothetical protein
LIARKDIYIHPILQQLKAIKKSFQLLTSSTFPFYMITYINKARHNRRPCDFIIFFSHATIMHLKENACALEREREGERERERERVPLKNVLPTRESEKGRSMSWYLVCCLSSDFFLPMFQPNKQHGLLFHPYETVFEMHQAIPATLSPASSQKSSKP